jgi:hypothetical protein
MRFGRQGNSGAFSRARDKTGDIGSSGGESRLRHDPAKNAAKSLGAARSEAGFREDER